MSRWRSSPVPFYSLVFLNALLFTDPITAALVTALLVLISTMAAQIGWIRRFDGEYPLVVRALFGLGLLQVLWTLWALVLHGRLRTAAVGASIVLLIVARRRLRQAKSQADRGPEPAPVAALALLAILLAALTYFPFRNLGRSTPAGIAYRAYFIADYSNHIALTQELTAHRVPPENPYFIGERFHYYWMPFSFPSLVHSLQGDVRRAVIGWAVTVNFLFLAALFILVRSALAASRWRGILAYAYSLTPLAAVSLEGFYLYAGTFALPSLSDFFVLGRAYNADGLTRWLWGLPQIDTLLRPLLYAPQHVLALAFFVVYLISRQHSQKPIPQALWILCLLFSFSSSLFIGAAFGLFFAADALYQLAHGWRQPEARKRGLRLAGVTGGAVIAALLLFIVLGILTMGGRTMLLRPVPLRLWLPYLGLNLGALLLTGLAGALSSLRRQPHFLALLLVLGAILTLRLQGFEGDLSLKFSAVAILILLAATLELFRNPGRHRAWLAAALVPLFLPGLFTAALDTVNTADIANPTYTYYLPAEERLLLEWGRTHLPADAIVQNYPPARSAGQEANLSIIPAFMGRRTLVGDELHSRIFLIPDGPYRRRLEQLRACLADLPRRRRELRRLGVDYLFWGAAEQEAFGYVPHLPVSHKVRLQKKAYLFRISGEPGEL